MLILSVCGSVQLGGGGDSVEGEEMSGSVAKQSSLEKDQEKETVRDLLQFHEQFHVREYNLGLDVQLCVVIHINFISHF